MTPTNENSCPLCKTDYETLPIICDACSFPFDASKEEKAKFIAQSVIKKGKITGTNDHIRNAQKILWFIAVLQVLWFVFFLVINPMSYLVTMPFLVIAVLFTGFGFLAKIAPFISILIPLLILIGIYSIEYYISTSLLYKGIIFKVFYLSGLSYALISIIRSNKLKKENEFLSKQ